MDPIRVAIAGVGNCASALVQGVAWYAEREGEGEDRTGLMRESIGGFRARDLEFVAPATWVSLANHVFHRQLVSGSWIHTGSVVRHLAAVPAASTVAIEGEVVDRSAHRLGTMATADLRFHVDDTVVVEIRHTALVELT